MGNGRKNAFTSASVRMSFSRKIERDTLCNKIRSSDSRKPLNIEPLLLRIERYQLRWLGHVRRMLQKRLSKELYLSKQMGQDQLEDLEPDGPIVLKILDGIA